MPKFIQVGEAVLNLSCIASVRFDGDSTFVYMQGGYNYQFRGEEAAGVRRYFRATEEAQAQANG